MVENVAVLVIFDQSLNLTKPVGDAKIPSLTVRKPKVLWLQDFRLFECCILKCLGCIFTLLDSRYFVISLFLSSPCFFCRYR